MEREVFLEKLEVDEDGDTQPGGQAELRLYGFQEQLFFAVVIIVAPKGTIWKIDV